MEMSKDRIFVALDVDTPAKAVSLVDMLAPHVGGFKFGLELITSMIVSLIVPERDEAHDNLVVIRKLFDLVDGRCFWDGKFDDIPNTVGKASGSVSKLNVKMFNLHASADIEAMMKAVSNKGDALVLAVTVLTAIEENDAHTIFGAPSKAKVLQFARDAKLAGCDGIVCSPQELVLLTKRPELKGLLWVTPGIRSSDAKPDDQKRTMSAGEAIAAGADYLVIGRPITEAPDPVAAAQQIAQEISDALQAKSLLNKRC